MNREVWKECRKCYTRSYICHCWLIFKLKCLKWFMFHLWYLITKYKHKHVWNINCYCLICKKPLRDIDIDDIALLGEGNDS